MRQVVFALFCLDAEGLELFLNGGELLAKFGAPVAKFHAVLLECFTLGDQAVGLGIGFDAGAEMLTRQRS